MTSLILTALIVLLIVLCVGVWLCYAGLNRLGRVGYRLISIFEALAPVEYNPMEGTPTIGVVSANRSAYMTSQLRRVRVTAENQPPMHFGFPPKNPTEADRLDDGTES